MKEHSTILVLLLGIALAFTQKCPAQVTVEDANAVRDTISDRPTVVSEKVAVITFDSLHVDLGTFKQSEPERSCTFNFTNTGTAPLLILNATATCGCTVPSYSKKPIMPGGKGTIEVKYNGKGKLPGVFRKTIVLKTNAQNDDVRLTIEGIMTE